MAEGKEHDKHIAQIFKKSFLSGKSEKLSAIQDAVYLLMDLTMRDKNSKRANRATRRLREWNIADINGEDIAAFESSASTHQYYAHLGWNYDYTVDGLHEQEKTAEWQSWTRAQCEEFKTHLQNCQRRFMLGKSILCKTLQVIFPHLPPSRINALARLCYYTHIYGDLRWNSRLDYLIDMPQFRSGLIAAVADFYDGTGKERQGIEITARIKQELPAGLVFTIPAAGDDAPLEEWKHCIPLNKAMDTVWGLEI
ncbi:hypothetical protein [Treponema phagedenis]|uniref:hypothetical protein n=1 Tax=Treponema phagedenis TaxID=162 RepID=UPI0011E7D57E|nr:hypothetical protein [Treponema phagedenis]QEJ99875.1 hypothetical protein FUT84_00910 [Treponema phagedenis]QEK07408.1 hypothetical protein FUT80_12220 [Treponema phagedenis]